MALLDPVEDGELVLGADRLGALVRGALEDEGVDLRWVREDAGAPTGLFYKWRADGRTAVAYYRRGSAASRLEPADVPDEALAGARVVHLTGITMALSASARALVLDVARRAHEAGATVTFDPNYRPALWDGPEAAGAAIEPVLEHVDWYLCGEGEGCALLGADDAHGALRALAARGVGGAVVRVGERGALVA